MNDDFNSWSYKKLHTTIDSSVFNDLNKVQNLKYQRDIDFDELTRLPYRAMFGYACGIAGTMPEDGMKMQGLVFKNNSSELENWLVGISPVKQAYAYLGLKLLHSRGLISLTEETLKIMRELESNSTGIYSCSGCTFWDYAPMKEQLSAENVKIFINNNKK